MIFDPRVVPSKSNLSILDVGNYLGEIDEVKLLDPFENGDQKYQITCIADGGTARYTNMFSQYVNDEPTNKMKQGWSMLTKICESVGISVTEGEELPDLTVALPTMPIAFQVGYQVKKDAEDNWVYVEGERKDGSTYRKTVITAFARSKAGLPPERKEL